MHFRIRFATFVLSVVGISPIAMQAQEVGFIEKFALATDRDSVLQDLIPGSEEYFYYHCLHYQNTKQLSKAETLLNDWRTKLGTTPLAKRIETRQQFLAYSSNHRATLDYIRRELGLNLDHAPPQADRAKDLATRLDPALIDANLLIRQAVSRDPNFGGLDETSLAPFLGRTDLNKDQLRALLARIKRVDWDNLVPAIERELRLNDSRGFGAIPIHAELTLAQRQELARRMPQLLENDVFVRQYLIRLHPGDDADLTDITIERNHLQRLEAFTDTLPASQNNLKANVLFHRLQLDASQGTFDRTRFTKYLTFPRQQVYYSQDRLKSLSTQPPLDFSANYAGEIRRPPIQNDVLLIRQYLEHFFQSEDNVNAFATWLDRKYLQNVLAETRILYALGPSQTWYDQLSPASQREIRERIELKFAATSKEKYQPNDSVALVADIKNVSQLIVRIYNINARNAFRKNAAAINTDLDLDGLVANSEQTLTYATPADRRHRENIPLPQLEGRGVWVVDLLGGGLRSRALIQKGQLRSVQRITDAGHEFFVLDESGKKVPTAHVEVGNRKFTPEAKHDGAIIVPFGEQDRNEQLLLVDGQFSTLENFQHRSENYKLECGFLIDTQNLLSGQRGSMVIRPQLLCNGQPVSLDVLKKVQLQITTVDQDGIESTQNVSTLELHADREATHQFLVPQRLASIRTTLSAEVLSLSKNATSRISASQQFNINGVAKSAQVSDFFLVHDDQGYRLQVRGRNGEPIARLPVTIQLKANYLTQPVPFTLATAADGQVILGHLPRFGSLQASAEGLEPRSFPLRYVSLDWPAEVHVSQGQAIELPWHTISDSNELSKMTLYELRGGVVFADRQANCKISDGQLTITGLEAGNYRLQDYSTSTTLTIRIAQGTSQEGFVVGASQWLEESSHPTATISKSTVVDGKLQIHVANHDPLTRVHLVAAPFHPDQDFQRLLRVSPTATSWQPRRPTQSFYINSLRLDEEYQYILQRQYATKYPGNLLTQPSLLLNPWDTASTANDRRNAQGGDAPAASATPPLARMQEGAGQTNFGTQAAGGKVSGYEFLARGSIVIANRRPNDAGVIEVPLAQLAGYQAVTAILVHPSGTNSQNLPIPASEIATKDLRLAKAFDAGQHLTQRQSVRVLNAGQKIDLGDARSTRVQVFASLADVYRLYSTLIPSADWERFRIVSTWNKLPDADKQKQYNELACHELHLFLYFKDRPFFDRVVKPYLSDKFETQLIDKWLLDHDLSEYTDLWQLGRLNTVERILMSLQKRQQLPGTKKWINDWVVAHPVTPQNRSQRFSTALATTTLDSGLLGDVKLEFVPDLDIVIIKGSQADVSRALGAIDAIKQQAEEKDAAGALLAESAQLSLAQPQAAGRGGRGAGGARAGAARGGVGGARGGGAAGGFGGGGARGQASEAARRDSGIVAQQQLYRTLESTRQWAENQFYHVGLDRQNLALVPPNAFWAELITRDSIDGFLPENLDLPVSSLSEALLALSVLDLPLEPGTVEMSVDDGRLMINSQNKVVAFIESIEQAKTVPAPASLLVGQDIYLANPSSDPVTQKPLTGQSLVRGVAYRTNIVVTNPTSQLQTVSVLSQLPAGSIPLTAGKVTKSHALDLQPYSTQQVQTNFYFPVSGEFEHYGTQVSVQDTYATSSESKRLRVLDQPEQLDRQTWGYVADWGTSDEVLEFLATKNTQQIDLSRIAFRMKDREFFVKCTRELSRQHLFEPNLWAYAVIHDDQPRVAEFLAHRDDIVGRCGPVLNSELFSIDSADRYSYQHLDYRPLVVARAHQLGAKRVVLNDRLFAQYNRLLERIAHQPKISSADSMALTYYMLLQNRIDDSLKYFAAVNAKELGTQLQYDYFKAYLDFYRGQYKEASDIATSYASYGVPRWRELFSQVASHVQQRRALVEHLELPPNSGDPNTDKDGRLLTGTRETEQATAATQTAALDLQNKDGQLILTHQNLDSVDINYYLMDIELLFSRNPFVQQDADRLITILPNESQRLPVTGKSGQHQLVLPAKMKNRNVLIEVAAGPLIRSQVVYANTLNVTVVDAFGRLQVLAQDGGSPVEKAYVKVYARNQSGEVRFYKDGYTDLRGQFDYSSLSTNDLDIVNRFSILILHPERGALIREVGPPKR